MITPLRARFSRRSKLIFPSAFGYSMGEHLAAGSVASLSVLDQEKVQGSRPRVVNMLAPVYAMPPSNPVLNAGLQFRTSSSSFQAQDSRTAHSYSWSSAPAWAPAKIPTAALSPAIIPVFIARCDPLILGTFRKPAEHPARRPPGKLSFGSACNPPSLRQRAP